MIERVFLGVLMALAAAAVFLAFAAIAGMANNPKPKPHVERIDADGVACVAVKIGGSTALSCNWPATAPKWWSNEHEQKPSH